MLSSDTRRGFTLVDLAVVIALCVTVAAIAGPTLNLGRKEAMAQASANNLRMIGMISVMYAQDHGGRIASYNWPARDKGYVIDYTLPNGDVHTSYDDGESAALQITEILMRRTGRIDGAHAIELLFANLPHRRFLHLILWDYLGGSDDLSLFADPMDRDLQIWQANPLEYGPGTRVPYADGAAPEGYDNSSSVWQLSSFRQRWAFASSYSPSPAVYLQQPPYSAYYQYENSPHLFRSGVIGQQSLHLGRKYTEVVFPSSKVYFYEEFDRQSRHPLYFAYDAAQPRKLMFDGSVNDLPSGQSRSSVSYKMPYADPEPTYQQVIADGTYHWRQAYIPLDKFPAPLGGLGDDTPLDFRYRWTYKGLSGIDYAQPFNRRPAPVHSLGQSGLVP